MENKDLYVHKKSGRLYRVVGKAFYCGDNMPECDCIIYKAMYKTEIPMFIRSADEFFFKFDKVES